MQEVGDFNCISVHDERQRIFFKPRFLGRKTGRQAGRKSQKPFLFFREDPKFLILDC